MNGFVISGFTRQISQNAALMTGRAQQGNMNGFKVKGLAQKETLIISVKIVRAQNAGLDWK